MRVAFLSPSAEIKNGWGVVTAELYGAFVREFSHDIDIRVYLPNEETKKPYYQSLPFQERVYGTLPPFAWSFRNPRRLYTYLRTQVLAGEIPDIIHVLDFPYAVCARANAKNKGIPYTVTLCGTFYKPNYSIPDRYFFKKVYGDAANVNAISQFTLNAAIEQFRIPRNKTTVIHPGVNYSRFSTPSDTTKLRERYGSNRKVILGVGALKHRKGFDIVINAIREVQKRIPTVLYILVGEGTDELALRALVHEFHLENNVVFAGKVADEALPAYFHFADVYCHTPRNKDGAFEGFGIVYLEAGAAGKPVIGSRSGGVPDAILDKKTGFLVPEEDSGALAQALLEILEHPALAYSLGEAGRVYAKKHAWRAIAQAYIDVYRTCLNTDVKQTP